MGIVGYTFFLRRDTEEFLCGETGMGSDSLRVRYSTHTHTGNIYELVTNRGVMTNQPYFCFVYFSSLVQYVS
jgi:hypothetical protein